MTRYNKSVYFLLNQNFYSLFLATNSKVCLSASSNSMVRYIKQTHCNNYDVNSLDYQHLMYNNRCHFHLTHGNYWISKDLCFR